MIQEISLDKLIKEVSCSYKSIMTSKGNELRTKLNLFKIKKIISVPRDGDCAFWCLFVALSLIGICPESSFKKYLENDNNNNREYNINIYLNFYHKSSLLLSQIISLLSETKGKEIIKNLRQIIAECYLGGLLKNYNLEDALEIYNYSSVGDMNKSITHDSFCQIINKCLNIDVISIIPAYDQKKHWQLNINSKICLDTNYKESFPHLNQVNNISTNVLKLSNEKKIILLNSDNHYYLLLN